MQTSSTSFTTNSMNTMSASQRFNGMIREKATKKLRNILFHFFDYITVTAPSMRGLQAFISIWRIIEFIGPSLCVGYIDFWGKGTNLMKTMDVISIIFHIFPGSELRKQVAHWFLIAEGCFFLLIILYVLLSAIYYHKYAQLPDFVPVSIFFIFSTFGYILPPIGMNFIGEIAGYMIQNPKEEVDGIKIFAMIFAFCAFFCFMVIFTTVYSVTLSFRSDSLTTIIPTNQSLITTLTLLVTFFPACGSKIVSMTTTIIFNLLAAITYAVSILVLFSKGGFVNQTYLKAMVSTATTGIIFCIIVALYVGSGKIATEVIIIIFVVVWIIVFILTSVGINRKTSKSLMMLDVILDDQESFNLIRNTRQFCQIVVDGFRNAHPSVLNFSVFKIAIEKWPKNYDIWLLFAKFMAIYPEQTQQLSYITIGMMQNKMKGNFAKHTMQQIGAAVKQRETNLIPELKTKIDRIGRKVSSNKAKIRYIWDLVLQGNVQELEPIIGRAYTSIIDTNIAFTHLIHMYPNNRFVARAYARFVRDVVADHEKHAELSSKVTNLQRGIQVEPDLYHDLGMYAFPNLPKQLESAKQISHQQGNITEDTLTQEIDGDDEKAAIDAEMKSSIKESINRISIPSYKMLRIVHLTLYFILFLIPFIVVSIYGPIFIDETTGSLEYLYELAKLRFTLFQGFGLMVHYAGENLNLTYGDDMEYPGLVVFPFMNYEQLSNTFDEIETPGESWGSTFDTADQLKFVNQDLANILMKVQPLKSYKIGDTAMNEVREKIFSSNFQLKLYSNPVYDENWNISTNNLSTIHYDTFIQNMSLIDAGAIFLAQFNEVFKSSTIPTDVFNQRYYAIPINNIRGMSDEISSATSLMLTYYTQLNLRIQMICKISIIAFITVVTLIYIIVCTAIIISMNHDKIAIYKCLTTIQKSVVSRVAESLKILRKDESEDRSSRLHDEELSKQEENLLKLFSTSSDAGGSQSNDNSQTIALTCLLIVAHAAMVVYLILCFSAAGNQLDQTTPHIDHIYASYTYEFATVLLLHLLPGAVYPSVNYQSDGFDKNSILRVIDEWQTRSQEEFAMVKYGDKNNNAPSFGELGIDINSVVQSASCDNDFIANDFHDTYRCYSPEATLCVTQMLETQLASTYLYSKGHEMYAGNSLYLSHIWHMSMVHVFDQYFDPLFNEMNILVIDSMNARLPFMNAVSYSVAAIVIIVIIIYLYEMDISEKKQKYALTLLLHCPGKVVLSNSNAIALLANNFSHSEIDFTNRDSDFYEYLVQDMPDSMIIMKVDGTIMSMNHSTERIYGINTEDYLSNSIVKFGEVFNDTNPFKELFESAEKKSFQRKDLKILRNGKDEVCIEMEFEAMAEWFFVVSRDITQNVMYDKLIQEEKAKSDQLLSSILPPRLVARVAAGEKDISFAVQSVTIVFMDIVSFTPWCGSLPAATVMKTLNMLFKEFDALTQIHTTMTKIKCIGDCYMAAGGIFMEVNQPAIHAKDVVEFGLDSIDSVLHVNEILDENLRIRVGVNTGGPIVAGVLGIEKPTFEILGPTINMAQQIEHHGVPMKVHISRAVYELIYGGNFKIQERGEIELKNGNTVTYVVERTKDK